MSLRFMAISSQVELFRRLLFSAWYLQASASQIPVPGSSAHFSLPQCLSIVTIPNWLFFHCR